MFDYQIAETRGFEKSKRKISDQLYSKIKDVIYPQLRKNPYFGPNIKKLKGKLEGYYRFRVGKYRVFYLIDPDKKLAIIVDIQHRQGSYD